MVKERKIVCERGIIVESNIYELQNRLNKYYADWEIAASFYEVDEDFMLLIMEREVEENESK